MEGAGIHGTKIRAKLILQLRSEGLSGRAIAASQGMVAKEHHRRVGSSRRSGVSWDDVVECSEDEVYDLLSRARDSTTACSPNRTGRTSTGNLPESGSP